MASGAPVDYRWALIGAFHDRLGHAGISQTLAVLSRHYYWPGVKADVAAFINQCQACQMKKLTVQCTDHAGLPRMSTAFEHVHIDLCGPFPLRALVSPKTPRRGR